MKATYVLRYMAVLVALATACMLPGSARAQGEEPLRVPAGQHVDGSVATVAQSIVVDGDVAGDVTSWRGDITVRGHVGGDVVSYAGRVTVEPSARIEGSVLAAGGQLQGATKGHVAGQAFGESENGRALASVVTLFMPASDQGTARGGAANSVFFGFMAAVFLMVFSLLWAALWPRRMAATTLVLRALPLRSLGMGLLSTLVLAAAVVPLTALLTATLIGLPVVIVLLPVLQLPYIYGFAALAHALGGGAHAATISGRTALTALGMAALVGVVTAFMPLAGVVLFYLMASPGVGAAVLSRGGVVLPWMGIASAR
jgi:cytoskeletal protein CcmA (bactofilin family)